MAKYYAFVVVDLKFYLSGLLSCRNMARPSGRHSSAWYHCQMFSEDFPEVCYYMYVRNFRSSTCMSW